MIKLSASINTFPQMSINLHVTFGCVNAVPDWLQCHPFHRQHSLLESEQGVTGRSMVKNIDIKRLPRCRRNARVKGRDTPMGVTYPWRGGDISVKGEYVEGGFFRKKYFFATQRAWDSLTPTLNSQLAILPIFAERLKLAQWKKRGRGVILIFR